MNRSRKQYTVLIAAALAVGLALTGCATPNTQPAADQEVSAAQATLRDFQRDPDMTWFQENLKNARAVIISPRAAFYARNASPVDILVRGAVDNPAAAPLRQSLAAGAR